MQQDHLVADVGGTNIRIAIAYKSELNHIETYKCAEFSSLEAAINHYIEQNQLTVNKACICIAGAVNDEEIKMTNMDWRFSAHSIEKRCAINKVHLINDYHAIAMSLPHLSSTQLITMSKRKGQAHAPKMVCGPGTGLGIAQLVPIGEQYHCISGEGGHIAFAPTTEQQMHVLAYLFGQHKRVSIERLLSGQGIVNIYQALAAQASQHPQPFDAKDITDAFINQADTLCVESVTLFLEILAQFLGDLVLMNGAFGGVYISGGIMPRIIEHVDLEQFNQCYTHKGRFKEYVDQAPLYLITEPQPGLIGAAAYLYQSID
ncbi:glucokinase [Shewanella surugensis]|uniref:Glucokinase n=1 Tax=Shewanella surugensis TaxID=212020 RepID=A0ABT0LC61_9GAMM|nr:glucokinase [Shewanella surugensis]MCL1125273.1 glucokinase [Shewanella surugensis]